MKKIGIGVIGCGVISKAYMTAMKQFEHIELRAVADMRSEPAQQRGKEFGVPLDLASMTQQTFMKGKAAYGGAAQSTQIAKLLEDVLNTDLRAPGFPARLE